MESYYRAKFFGSIEFDRRVILSALDKDRDFGQDLFAFDAIFILEAITAKFGLLKVIQTHILIESQNAEGKLKEIKGKEASDHLNSFSS